MKKRGVKSFFDVFLKLIKPIAMFFIYIAVIVWFLFLYLFNRKKFKEVWNEKEKIKKKKEKIFTVSDESDGKEQYNRLK